MLYKLTKQIRENGGATKEDLKTIEPYLTTGPIKFDNSRFYKNVEFIKQNYDILDYITREIDVSYIQNEKLAELVFYLNIITSNAKYNVDSNSIEFTVKDNPVVTINTLIFGNLYFWSKFYKENEEPFILKSSKNIHNLETFELKFNVLDDKILDILLSLIYQKKLFKVAEALPKVGMGYNFIIDHRHVYEPEFKAYRNKVSKFLDTMVDKYKIERS